MRTLLVMAALLVASGCAAATRGPAASAAAAPCTDDCATDNDAASTAPMLEALIEDSERSFEIPEFSCPHDPAEIPEFARADDSHVPRFEPTRTRATNMHHGEERLSDATILEHLEHATTQVFACLDVAACYADADVAAGDIEFALEVEASGQVRGVDVTMSAHLEDLGVAACARRAIYQSTFPAYNGGGTWVTYTIEI